MTEQSGPDTVQLSDINHSDERYIPDTGLFMTVCLQRLKDPNSLNLDFPDLSSRVV